MWHFDGSARSSRCELLVLQTRNMINAYSGYAFYAVANLESWTARVSTTTQQYVVRVCVLVLARVCGVRSDGRLLTECHDSYVTGLYADDTIYSCQSWVTGPA
jgi:hypothetical protein